MTKRKIIRILVLVLVLAFILNINLALQSKISELNEQVTSLKKEISQSNTLIEDYESRYYELNRFWDLIKQYSYFEQDYKTLDHELSMVLPNLINDPYADAQDDKSFSEDFSRNKSMFGFRSQFIENRWIITNVVRGSSADVAGLEIGDILISIDNLDLSKLSEELLSSHMKSNEKITVTLLKSNQSKLISTISKKYTYIPPVQVELIDPNTAYFKIQNFSNNLNSTAIPKLRSLADKNIANIIIDLRDNYGGDLGQAVGLLDFFIQEGILVNYEDKDSNVESISAVNTGSEPQFNLAILVDEMTASASELVASSMRENLNVPIIGSLTYGKGLRQGYFIFDDGTYLKLTTHKVYVNEDKQYDKVGIRPDIIVDTRPWITPQTDEAVDATLEYFETLIN